MFSSYHTRRVGRGIWCFFSFFLTSVVIHTLSVPSFRGLYNPVGIYDETLGPVQAQNAIRSRRKHPLRDELNRKFRKRRVTLLNALLAGACTNPVRALRARLRVFAANRIVFRPIAQTPPPTPIIGAIATGGTSVFSAVKRSDGADARAAQALRERNRQRVLTRPESWPF